MKIQFSNLFHHKTATIEIKDYFAFDESPITALSFEVYTKGFQETYAKRKLKEIKDKLCGSNDCSCGGHTTFEKLQK